ncbi:hypothetical protein Tco_1255871 [Tanacetum coccineum]
MRKRSIFLSWKKIETLVYKRSELQASSKTFLVLSSTLSQSVSRRIHLILASYPFSTASPYEGLSLDDQHIPEEDDSEIPPLEDIYQNSTDGIITTISYDDEEHLILEIQPAVTNKNKVNTSSGVSCLLLAMFQKQKITNQRHSSLFISVSCLNMNPRRFHESSEEKQLGFDAMQEELRGTIKKTLFLKKDKHDIILVQVYVDDIIFGSTKRSWCDEFEALMKSRFQMSFNSESSTFPFLITSQTEGIMKPLVKDEEASDVDVHLYRSMIGSLMYLTASRPDIMYLKGKPKLGLWYPRVSSFDLESYSDSDYAGANLDRKSTTGEAEYVAAASCCGQVLWIQNQMLDYGFNFMNTKIYIDNESTICIVKNPVYHSKTKHIAIRHHFIRDAYEKKLIQVLKIHTDDNVADLLTKAFDVSRGLKEFRELLSRVTNGTEALLLPTLFFLFALIFIFTTISIPSKMAVLDSCPKHNMVAYLEKSEGNVEFHEIIDFLKRSYIHHALTVPTEHQSNLSPRPSPPTNIPGSISESFGENLGVMSPNRFSDQARKYQALKAQITKLKKQAKPSYPKTGRKFAKGESSVQRDPLFDEMPEDTVDHMDTGNAQDEGRTREIVDEDKETEENALSTEEVLSTDKEGVSTDEQVEGTEEPNEGTEELNEGTEKQNEGTEEKVESTDGQIKGTEDQTEEEIATQASTQTPTSMIFGDDETIAKVLLNMSQAKAVSKEKEKGVELKDVEETDRPRPTSTRSLLTLKPLPKIDPKDKGKKKIEEKDESDGIPQAEKKFKQLESDEELARKVQEEWEAEGERNRIAEENVANEDLIRDFDDSC